MTGTHPDKGLGVRDGAPRILVIEPNRNALGVMTRRLAEAGYRAVGADSAAAGIAELRRLPIDLIVAELRTTPMSGVDLVRLIREDAQMKDMPIILITGRSDKGGAVEAFGCGADDVVAKPFHFEVLLARIARRLAIAESVRGLETDKSVLDARVVERAMEIGELKTRLADLQAARRD